MPARPAGSPGAVPGRLSGLGALPQGEIERVLLFFSRCHARPGLKLLDVATGELAVALEGAHPEIDVPRARGVGLAQLHERTDQGDHLRNVFRGLGFDVRPQDLQPVHVLIKGVDVARSQGLAGHAVLPGPDDDFIVDVGEVAGKGHGVALVAQESDQDVKDHGRAGMAYVAQIVGGDAADIELHTAGHQWNELFLAPGQRIVEQHGVFQSGRCHSQAEA